MSADLRLFNRQQTKAINTGLLRQVVVILITEMLGQDEFDLTIHLIGARKMAQVNQEYLGHEGPTDVVTLDYCTSPDKRNENAPALEPLVGEIYVCTDVVIDQARHYRAPWPVELVRYIIHGLLHLQGYDDHTPATRRVMKRAEGLLLRRLDRRFRLSKLAGKTKLAV